jgi:hypothetical protein
MGCLYHKEGVRSNGFEGFPPDFEGRGMTGPATHVQTRDHAQETLTFLHVAAAAAGPAALRSDAFAEEYEIGRLPFRHLRFQVSAHAAHNILDTGESGVLEQATGN